jgi:WD40 repeat protein
MIKNTDWRIQHLLKWVLFLLITAMPWETYAQKPRLMLPIGHVGGAELIFSPDSRKMLTRGNDGTAKIWDVQTGLMLADLVGHKGKISTAAFCSDGQKIITTSEDNTARIWSVSSGELLQTLGNNRGNLNSAELFANDKVALLSQSIGDVPTKTVWDVNTGNLLYEINQSKFRGDDGKIHGSSPSATISRDGKNIARIDYFHLQRDSIILVIADIRSGRRLDTLQGFFPALGLISYSPDGKNIIAIGQYYFKDSSANDPGRDPRQPSWATMVWNAGTGKLQHILKLGNFSSYDRWNSDGEMNSSELFFDPANKDLLFINTGFTIEPWNMITGKIVLSLAELTKKGSYRLSKNKRTVFIKDDHTLQVIDVLTGKITGSFHPSAKIESYRVDEKNSVLLVITNNQVQILDLASGKLLRSFNGENEKITAFAYSPFEKYISIVTRYELDKEDEEDRYKVKLWDWGSNHFIWSLDIAGEKVRPNFSPDGKSLAIQYNETAEDGYDDELTVIDITTGKNRSNFLGHASYARCGAFSPDKKRIVTAYSDSTIKIWDSQKGQFLATLSGHQDLVNMVEFNSDGSYLASASNDSTAKIWDAYSGKLLHTLNGNDGPVYAARFSPDTKYLVTVSDHDGRVWEVGSGKLLRVLKGSGGIDALFSPDGKYIISGSRVWNTLTGKLLYDLDWHNGTLKYSQFSTDGKYIVTASGDETAKLWSVEYGELLYSFDEHTDEVVFATFSKDNKEVITASLDNTVKVWDVQTGKLKRSLDLGANTVVMDVDIEGNKLLCVSSGSLTSIVDLSTGERLYSYLSMEKSGFLTVDKFGRFDGTENARKLLYFVCDDEVIELDQVKDQLWTPGLVERIVNGDSINALKLADLDICGLTPQVKEMGSSAEEYHFRITPRRGGIGETALYMNGIEIRRYTRSQLKYSSGNYELVVKKNELHNYLMRGQDNAVNVKAWVADNTISSRGAIVQLQSTKDSMAIPNLYAVFVGISDYKGNELDLKYAAKDAQDISYALSIAARKLLNNDGKEHVFTYDLSTAAGRLRLPEKAGIRKTLEEIGSKAKANDILLLFFAGHGVMEGKDKKQFYFLTADASRTAVGTAIGDMGISTAELTEWVKPEFIKAQKRIMIFDACNSGQLIKDFVQLGKPGQGYVAARSDENGQQIKAIEKLNSQSGMIILSASASNQSAYEMSRYSQGLLTYSLLKVMKQQPEILVNGRYLDVTNWLNATKKMVGQLAEGSGARQEPQLNTNNDFSIGVVDEDVRSKIILSSEKPLFTRSNFQNLQTKIDDLKLRQATDKEFLQLGNAANADITFSPDYDGNDGYSLNGDYKITGDQVVITFLLVKGGIDIKYRYELKGSLKDLPALSREMTQLAVAWLKSNQ